MSSLRRARRPHRAAVLWVVAVWSLLTDRIAGMGGALHALVDAWVSRDLGEGSDGAVELLLQGVVRVGQQLVVIGVLAGAA